MIVRCRAKGCGKLIRYVKTESGANMPCDARGIWIVPDPTGPDLAFRDRQTVRGYIVTGDCDGSIMAFLSHFKDCAIPDEYRKPKAATAAKPKRRAPIKDGEITGVSRGFKPPMQEYGHEQFSMFPEEPPESPKEEHMRIYSL